LFYFIFQKNEKIKIKNRKDRAAYEKRIKAQALANAPKND